MEYFVHKSSEVESNKIGNGTRIWHYSHILPGTKIGRNCVIGQNVMIGPDVSIGDGCKIQNNVSIYEGVTLEDKVFCGPSMVFTNVLNPRAHVERKNEFTEVLVKEGASIGANATIVGNVTIGRYAMIGAGSIVTKDVRDYSLSYGVPARERGWACECGEILERKVFAENKKILDCGDCGLLYKHFKDEFGHIDKI
jgi:UDP-2-acetamido-3-amino-2,3-dideoxy-glucuronate N-acetyltransferase